LDICVLSAAFQEFIRVRMEAAAQVDYLAMGQLFQAPLGMCPACAATPAGGGPEGAAASALMGDAAARNGKGRYQRSSRGRCRTLMAEAAGAAAAGAAGALVGEVAVAAALGRRCPSARGRRRHGRGHRRCGGSRRWRCPSGGGRRRWGCPSGRRSSSGHLRSPGGRGRWCCSRGCHWCGGSKRLAVPWLGEPPSREQWAPPVPWQERPWCPRHRAPLLRQQRALPVP
jgi:hypothetical protein